MSWGDAIACILIGAARRVIVIGVADVGKSSFCRALVAAAVEHGRAAALIDSDLGQKIVGPPAAVTRSEPGWPGRLDRLAFVGTTDPVRGFAGVVRGAGDLVRSCPADLIVINTSGLVSGSGKWLKMENIRATCPDLIVAIGEVPGLQAILSEHAVLRVVHLDRPPGARKKTEGERRAARREAFRAYFKQARTWDLAVVAPMPRLVERQLLGLRGADGCDLALALVAGPGGGETLRVLAPDLGLAAVTIVPSTITLDPGFGEVHLTPAVAR